MWDERYKTQEYVYGVEPNEFLAENVDFLNKGKILCLGEGEGRNAVYLARLGYQVTAVDISSVAAEKALRLAQAQGVSFNYIQSDLQDFQLGEAQWDGIISIFCHLPPEIRYSLHRRVITALKPAGVLLLEAYTAKQLQLGTGGPPTVDMMMSKSGLETEFEGLQFNYLEELKRDVIEGRFHNGVGAVVQLRAEKPI